MVRRLALVAAVAGAVLAVLRRRRNARDEQALWHEATTSGPDPDLGGSVAGR